MGVPALGLSQVMLTSDIDLSVAAWRSERKLESWRSRCDEDVVCVREDEVRRLNRL